MALRRLRYSEIEVQLIADVLSVWQKTCNGTWSCDTFLKSTITVLSNGHIFNFFCPIGKNKENTYLQYSIMLKKEGKPGSRAEPS